MQGIVWSSTAKKLAVHNRNKRRLGKGHCQRQARPVHPLAAGGALELHVCTPVSQELPDPEMEALRDPKLHQANLQELVVNRVVGSGEVED